MRRIQIALVAIVLLVPCIVQAAIEPIIFHDPLGRSSLTVSVKLYDSAGLQHTISAAESPASSGRYVLTNAALTGDTVTSGTYDVTLEEGGNLVGLDTLYWDGSTAIALADAVRTELATELARIDVATSTRNATAPPTAVANATQVRTELATELARIDVATSTRNSTAPDNATLTAINAKLPADTATKIGLIEAMRGTDSALLAANYTPFTTHLSSLDNTSYELATSGVVSGSYAFDLKIRDSDGVLIDPDAQAVSLDRVVLVSGPGLGTFSLDTVGRDGVGDYALNFLVPASGAVIDSSVYRFDLSWDVSSQKNFLSEYVLVSNGIGGIVDTASSVRAIESEQADSAAQVRTELATELARIDVATSTRNDVTPPTPPTVAEVAAAILTTPANTLAVNASGQVVASNSQNTNRSSVDLSYVALPFSGFVAPSVTATASIRDSTGTLNDPDGEALTAVWISEGGDLSLSVDVVNRIGVGVYEIALLLPDAGIYDESVGRLELSYVENGLTEVYSHTIRIGNGNGSYVDRANTVAAIESKLPDPSNTIAGGVPGKQTLDQVETDGINSIGGGNLVAVLEGQSQERQVFKILQGSTKTLTIIVQSQTGVFDAAVPANIEVNIKDADDNVQTVENADIVRIAEDLQVQVFRFTLTGNMTAMMSKGFLDVQFTIDSQLVELGNHIRILKSN